MTKKGRGFWTPLRIVASIVLGLVIFGVGTALLLHGKDIPALNPSGVVAQHEKDLLIFTLMLSGIVVIPVFLMLGVFAWRYRENGGTGKYTPDEEDNHWFEALWWGIPIAIIGILGVVTVVSTHQLDPMKPLASNVKPLVVEVVALQWRWLFIYPEQGIATINELRIPVGTPVNFQLTADGPMSGFWIPALGTQTYAMTGMSAPLKLQADKVGSYRGSNSNISGTGYSDMDFQAIAMPSRKAFDDWAASIEANEDHKHLEWSSYQKLAVATRNKQVSYFHLHDDGLYTEIINKFLLSGRETGKTEGTH